MATYKRMCRCAAYMNDAGRCPFGCVPPDLSRAGTHRRNTVGVAMNDRVITKTEMRAVVAPDTVESVTRRRARP